MFLFPHAYPVWLTFSLIGLDPDINFMDLFWSAIDWYLAHCYYGAMEVFRLDVEPHVSWLLIKDWSCLTLQWCPSSMATHKASFGSSTTWPRSPEKSMATRFFTYSTSCCWQPRNPPSKYVRMYEDSAQFTYLTRRCVYDYLTNLKNLCFNVCCTQTKNSTQVQWETVPGGQSNTQEGMMGSSWSATEWHLHKYEITWTKLLAVITTIGRAFQLCYLGLSYLFQLEYPS